MKRQSLAVSSSRRAQPRLGRDPFDAPRPPISRSWRAPLPWGRDPFRTPAPRHSLLEGPAPPGPRSTGKCSSPRPCIFLKCSKRMPGGSCHPPPERHRTDVKARTQQRLREAGWSDQTGHTGQNNPSAYLTATRETCSRMDSLPKRQAASRGACSRPRRDWQSCCCRSTHRRTPGGTPPSHTTNLQKIISASNSSF